MTGKAENLQIIKPLIPTNPVIGQVMHVGVQQNYPALFTFAICTIQDLPALFFPNIRL